MIALPSVSAHTNGYTLLNQIWRDLARAERVAQHQRQQPKVPNVWKQWLRVLGAPHKCYLREVQNIQAAGVEIKGLVHITGGGLVDNPPRVLPDGLCFSFVRNTIEERMPEMFKWLRKVAKFASYREMYQTYNCGIGMLVVCNARYQSTVLKTLTSSFVVGSIQQQSDTKAQVVFE